MKKISLYLSLLVSMIAVSSCTEDYNTDIAEPQAWEQEELTTIPELTLTASADINLEENTQESIQFVNYEVNALPEGATIGDVIIEVAPSSDGAATAITHNDGAISAEALQTLIEGFYGKAAELRSLYVSARTNINTDGQASLIVATPVTVNVMPKTPIVVPEFYLVGGLQGWNNGSHSVALYPIDAEAATLSYTTNFSTYPDGATATPNFKIFSAEQIGSWDHCYGAEVDGDTSLTGKITADGGAIQCPTNDIYTLTIDMINNTYEMTLAENQEPTTYETLGLIGDFNGWGSQEAFTEVTPHNWCLEGFVQEADGGLKFRANDDWGLNWGGGINIGDINYGTLFNNGDNLTVPAGTYNVYLNDITGQTHFIKVE